MACLMDYDTNEEIRDATAEEMDASARAAKMDGGSGVILIDDDDDIISADDMGADGARRCYVLRL